MELKSTISLQLGDLEVHDCQLWGLELLEMQFSSNYTFICRVNRQLVPIYLYGSKPLTVYTNDDGTSDFFMKEVLRQNSIQGLLFHQHDKYLIFYYHQQQIECQPIDFEVLRLMMEERNEELKPNLRTNTFLFDKPVMLNIVATNLNPEPANTNNHNETQTINKLILSGLRLRGMSFKQKNISSNERLMIKEIYQMTQKSTQFALRKFNYSQNRPNDGIKLHDIQDIVEQLLSAFIDIKPGSNGLG